MTKHQIHTFFTYNCIVNIWRIFFPNERLKS